MGEIDRFMRSAQCDPGSTRRTRLDDREVKLITVEQRQRALQKRVRDLLLLVFNEERPFDRLSLVCGRRPEYWRDQLRSNRRGGISREAAKLLASGLRAHVMGIRDHLVDVDREIIRVEDAISEPGTFSGPAVKRVTTLTR